MHNGPNYGHCLNIEFREMWTAYWPNISKTRGRRKKNGLARPKVMCVCKYGCVLSEIGLRARLLGKERKSSVWSSQKLLFLFVFIWLTTLSISLQTWQAVWDLFHHNYCFPYIYQHSGFLKHTLPLPTTKTHSSFSQPNSISLSIFFSLNHTPSFASHNSLSLAHWWSFISFLFSKEQSLCHIQQFQSHSSDRMAQQPRKLQ